MIEFFDQLTQQCIRKVLAYGDTFQFKVRKDLGNSWLIMTFGRYRAERKVPTIEIQKSSNPIGFATETFKEMWTEVSAGYRKENLKW